MQAGAAARNLRGRRRPARAVHTGRDIAAADLPTAEHAVDCVSFDVELLCEFFIGHPPPSTPILGAQPVDDKTMAV